MSKKNNSLSYNCCNWCCWWKWCPAPPPPTTACQATANLVENGDFETDNGWSRVGDVTFNDSEKFSQEQIAVFRGTSSIYQEVVIPLGCPLQLSFAAKSTRGTSQVTKVSINFFNDDTPLEDSFLREFQPASNDYTTFLYAVDIPENANKVVIKFENNIQGSGPGNELTLDLVVLKV